MSLRNPQAAIIVQVLSERDNQDAKWGEQNHPSTQPGFDYAVRDDYRALCDRRTANGTLSWADIAGEELGEAIDAPNDTDRRAELVQLAAVVVAWIECLDRNGRK